MIDRREFLSYVPTLVALPLAPLLASAGPVNAAENSEELSPIENLMRAHGVLDRAMLIYDDARRRITDGEKVDPALLIKVTGTIHDYFADYHEKMEEKFIFAPMEKANQQFASIQQLKEQHGVGWELTERIRDLARANKLTPEAIGYLQVYVRMFRHHAAWEDTVIFPAFRSLVSAKELKDLGHTFESEERRQFGPQGFQTIVAVLADVERHLGIFDLASSTPKL
jgi:hemerythrin-like domain-containing protein